MAWKKAWIIAALQLSIVTLQVIAYSCQKERKECPQTRFLFPTLNQVSDYIRFKPAIPDMDDVSACMWLTPVLDDEYTLISYATKSLDNAFIVMFQKSKLSIFKSKNKVLEIAVTTKTHLCVVASDVFKSVAAYVNGVLHSAVTFPDGVPIKGGGSLVIGQEQDSVMGGFADKQSYTGEIENLMMWYRILTPMEIYTMYKNKCACAPGYSVALIPEWIQLGGSVTALTTQPC